MCAKCGKTLAEGCSCALDKVASELRAAEHKIKCLEIHRRELEAKLAEQDRQHERYIDDLKRQSRRGFWRKFLPPKIKILFGDEYDSDWE